MNRSLEAYRGPAVEGPQDITQVSQVEAQQIILGKHHNMLPTGNIFAREPNSIFGIKNPFKRERPASTVKPEVSAVATGVEASEVQRETKPERGVNPHDVQWAKTHGVGVNNISNPGH